MFRGTAAFSQLLIGHLRYTAGDQRRGLTAIKAYTPSARIPAPALTDLNLWFA